MSCGGHAMRAATLYFRPIGRKYSLTPNRHAKCRVANRGQMSAQSYGHGGGKKSLRCETSVVTVVTCTYVIKCAPRFCLAPYEWPRALRLREASAPYAAVGRVKPARPRRAARAAACPPHGEGMQHHQLPPCPITPSSPEYETGA